MCLALKLRLKLKSTKIKQLKDLAGMIYPANNQNTNNIEVSHTCVFLKASILHLQRCWS